jgi:threonine dehydrogenase-like Zn-dependent dehydrogenase
MQELLAVPVPLLHRSERLGLEQLALIETLGIGFHAVERARLQPEEWAVIVGAGPIGLATSQFALLAGANVVVIDTSPARREFAHRLGVRHVVEAGDGTESAVAALVGSELAHCVFDATGSLEAMSRSLTLAGPGGRVVMVGLAQGSFAVDDPLFHRHELTLLATRNSAGAFPPILRLIEDGRLDTAPWITHHLDLATLPETFPELLEPDSGVVKAMISA